LTNLEYNGTILGRVYLSNKEYVFQPALLDGYWDMFILDYILEKLKEFNKCESTNI
jgi:hypothetical protein